jgi:hypothetical protein
MIRQAFHAFDCLAVVIEAGKRRDYTRAYAGRCRGICRRDLGIMLIAIRQRANQQRTRAGPITWFFAMMHEHVGVKRREYAGAGESGVQCR